MDVLFQGLNARGELIYDLLVEMLCDRGGRLFLGNLLACFCKGNPRMPTEADFAWCEVNKFTVWSPLSPNGPVSRTMSHRFVEAVRHVVQAVQINGIEAWWKANEPYPAPVAASDPVSVLIQEYLEAM